MTRQTESKPVFASEVVPAVDSDLISLMIAENGTVEQNAERLLLKLQAAEAREAADKARAREEAEAELRDARDRQRARERQRQQERERQQRETVVESPADYVWYTSKAGNTRKYRVVRRGTGNTLQLAYSERKFFWVSATKCSPVETPSRGGTRYCVDCGADSCNIGPFAMR